MNSVLKEIEQQGLSRRVFLRNLLFAAGSVSTAKMLTACSSPNFGHSTPGVDPAFRSQFATMGPLQAPNADGIELPAGFTSRLLATFNQPVVPDNPVAEFDPNFVWHSDPDGGGTFRMPDGGWIYLSNSERRDSTTITGQIPTNPITGLIDRSRENAANVDPTFGGGGVSALRFNAAGELIDAYAVERNTTTNCSGGATPWGTWLNGEEIQDGFMFECSPLRDGGNDLDNPRVLPRFGRKGHEMVAVDENGKAIYHTEDAGGDDRFYRTIFTAADWPDGGQPDYATGRLQVLRIPDGLDAARLGPVGIEWLEANDDNPDGTVQPGNYPAGSTLLEGNEGVWCFNKFIFLSTKSDNSIWAIDTIGNTFESVYDPTDGPIGSPVDPDEPIMTGVDNITMTLDGEMLVVEDGGFMRCMVLLPDRTTIPLLRLPHTPDPATSPMPSEVTGVAIGPTGDKIYVSGQRSMPGGQQTGPLMGGVTYEITMPFSVRVNRPMAGALV